MSDYSIFEAARGSDRGPSGGVEAANLELVSSRTVYLTDQFDPEENDPLDIYDDRPSSGLADLFDRY